MGVARFGCLLLRGLKSIQNSLGVRRGRIPAPKIIRLK